MSHFGNDPMGAPTTHKGDQANCPAPECADTQDAKRRKRYEEIVRLKLEAFIKRPYITGTVRKLTDAVMTMADEELRERRAPDTEAEYRELVSAAAMRLGHPRWDADEIASAMVDIRDAELDRVRAERDELNEALLTARGDTATESLRAEQAEALAAALEKRLHDAAMTRTWTNEDGKKFVFVEDIAPHLLGTKDTTR